MADEEAKDRDEDDVDEHDEEALDDDDDAPDADDEGDDAEAEDEADDDDADDDDADDAEEEDEADDADDVEEEDEADDADDVEEEDAADDADDDDEDAEEEDEADDADDDADEDDEDADDEDADDDDDAHDDGDDADEDDEDRAADVAAALGVGDDDEADDDDDDEKPRKVNRAERRRQRALRRRKGRSDDDEPKDRNKRRRERLLKRRRQAAQAADEGDELAAPDGLLPSEMVDDALARSGAAAVRWVRNNWKVLQWVLTAAILGGAGAIAYVYFSTQTSEEASDTLADALWAEQASVIPPDDDPRTEEQKKGDLRNIYASYEEQNKAALDDYQKVVSEHGDTAAGILAKLGEAGVLLDMQQWDAAISAYDAVLASQLATVDKNVKLRALEGKGFGQEAKDDLDGALATFEKIAELGGEMHKVLSLYHQGRVYAAKKQVDQAKAKLQEARTAAEKAKLDTKLKSSAHPYRWLERAIVEELTAVDPSTPPLVKPGQQQLPPNIQQLLQQQKGRPGGLPGAP